MNGPLPAELKFRENRGLAVLGLPSLCLEKRFCFGGIINPLLTKLALSIWMNVCFFTFDFILPQKSGKTELGYYPALLLVSCFFSGYLLHPSDIFSFLLHKITYKQNIVVKNR